MDFLNIILEGYMDRDKREFFSDYIYQRFKEAEKEKFYKAEQFYKGLLNAVQDLKDILEAQFYERKKELLLLMELNKNSDKPGKEKEKRSASYSEELENLSVSHFSVNLTRLTSHRFTGALWQKDIDFIEDSIRLNLAGLHISEIKELLPKLTENTNKGATTPEGKPKQKKQVRTLIELFKDKGKYDYVMDVLIKNGKIYKENGHWLDKGSGYKTDIASLVKHLYTKGYLSDEPKHEVVKAICLNTFGVKMSIDAVKKANRPISQYEFISPNEG